MQMRLLLTGDLRGKTRKMHIGLGPGKVTRMAAHWPRVRCLRRHNPRHLHRRIQLTVVVRSSKHKLRRRLATITPAYRWT